MTESLDRAQVIRLEPPAHCHRCACGSLWVCAHPMCDLAAGADVPPWNCPHCASIDALVLTLQQEDTRRV